MKTCTLRGETKPLDQFHRRARSRDGHQAHCKACGRAALDAADARARARQRGVLVTRAEVEAVLATQADTVLDVLFACTFEGHVDVLDRLAEALHPDCPTMVEGYEGADCLLHDLGHIHVDQLRERAPEAVRAMGPSWQACSALDSGADRTRGEGAP